MRYFDNTRVSTYKECPRKFLFRHILGWVRDTGAPAAPLVFGSSWHTAMDVVWSFSCKSNKEQLDTKSLSNFAISNFISTWIGEGMPHPKDMSEDDVSDLEPRTPMIAHEMLYNYIEHRHEFMSGCDLLSVERPFVVPIFNDPKLPLYIGKMDKVVRKRSTGKILTIEHKTTSLYRGRKPDYYFTDDYIDQWSLSAQVDGYMYASMLEYGEELGGVYVDAAMVTKSVFDKFKFIPIQKALWSMDDWLEDVRQWVSEINTKVMLINGGVDPYSQFPKNCDSCFSKYNKRCTFFDICRFVGKPNLTEPPEGYKVDFWEPFDVLHLEKIGLEPEDKDIIAKG